MSAGRRANQGEVINIKIDLGASGKFFEPANKEGNIARLIAAISIIVVTIAMITYFAVGSGKFVGEFLGIPPLLGLSSQFWAATIMIVLAMIYTVASGLYGVVWTDVFQGILIFGLIIYICIIAMFTMNTML